MPSNPVRVLVLAHGYPWPDGSRSDGELIEYAQAAVERWAALAERHHAIVVAPAFGGQEFPLYREMLGRNVDPDEFVNLLVAKAGRDHISGFAGQFSLHGHSAGAQFAARYLVTHPQRLDEVQQGVTRIERAGAWVESMRRHAQGSGKAASVRFVAADGLDHDEEAMAGPAQEIMAQSWRTADLRR